MINFDQFPCSSAKLRGSPCSAQNPRVPRACRLARAERRAQVGSHAVSAVPQFPQSASRGRRSPDVLCLFWAVAQLRQCRSLRSFRLDVAWAGERTRDSKLRSFDSARSFAVPIPLLGRDRAARSGRQSRSFRSFRSFRSAEVSPGSTFVCYRSLGGRQNPAVAQLRQLRSCGSCAVAAVPALFLAV